jgi:hypothetical protein
MIGSKIRKINSKQEFSLSKDALQAIFKHAGPLGHNENVGNLNLGFGFMYYGIARALQPAHTLVVGSGYGFSVVCLGLGMKDNGVGRLTFVDPSYSILREGPMKTVGGRGNWDDPEKVRQKFSMFGLENLVTHYKMTSEEFFSGFCKLGLPKIDLAFVDGSHTFRDVMYDFTEIVARSRKNTYIFLHDTNIYVRELMQHAGVKKWIKILRKDRWAFEIVDFPFSSGVALVRVLEPNVWKRLQK